MGKSGIDKRRNPRVYFSNDDILAAEVSLAKGDATLVGDVLNLSIGGAQFSFKRDSSMLFNNGDKLTLSSIADHADLKRLEGVNMEIRWVLDHAFLDHIAVGCEFMGLIVEQQDSLQAFVDSHVSQL